MRRGIQEVLWKSGKLKVSSKRLKGKGGIARVLGTSTARISGGRVAVSSFGHRGWVSEGGGGGRVKKNTFPNMAGAQTSTEQ